MDPYRGFSVFPLSLRISFGASHRGLVCKFLQNCNYRLQVTGAGTGTGSGFFIAGTQRHDVLQENGTCIHYVDPWVVSHAHGQSEPQQWLQLNVCFILGVCEVFNWGILVWEILSVMQVEDPSTNPILASSAGCFIVAS